ncbi:MAG: ABC transporter ATP-binding protein [Rhodobacteraceae bacterium]|jgi:ABC-type sugar transport system ATPase subunit|nr:ABC transporter ATP-binding protein [Paracoccaceae bacterium]
MAEAAPVVLEGVGKTYQGADRPSLAGVSLAIAPGAFFSILGPSGCGKTTLLRIIAGFEMPTEGRVLIDGRDVTGLPPRARDIAMVFQDYALYPHMTAADNITFGLRNRRVPRREIAVRLEATAATLGITHLLGKRPDRLSGGERQRVALGRAIVRRPRVFLLDEPLSNLDLKLRETMRIELGRLHRELGVTMVFVTHDQAEAMTLSTTLAVLDGGRLQQAGPPDTVYARPANRFVARFIGSPSMNLLAMVAGPDGLAAAGAPAAAVLAAPAGLVPGPVEVGIRPHHLRPAGPGTRGLAVRVELVEHLGRSNFLVCTPVDAPGLLAAGRALVAEVAADVAPEPGSALVLDAAPRDMALFDPASGQAIAAVGAAGEGA